LLILYTT